MGDPLELLVAEAEAGAHRVGAGDVEHLARGHPAADQLDELGGEREQRVGGGERAVGQPHPQLVAGVPGALARDVGHAEGGGDQGCVGLDVGDHHEDVARLERRVVLEQPDQHLAQHVDLPGGAVAGVDLHGVVAGPPRGRSARRRVGAWLARRSCWSQPSNVPADGGGAAAGLLGRSPSVRRSSRASRPSELSSGCPTTAADVSTARGTWPSRAAGASASQSAVEACGSHRCTSRSSPRAVSSDDLGLRQAGVAEEGQPRRQVEVGAAGTQPGHGLRMAHVGRRHVDGGEQPAPELGLPAQVAVEGAAGAVASHGPRASR